ncbi:MAG: dihydrolipoamide acetyltransferase family protein [Egibacteraceae bacterium]
MTKDFLLPDLGEGLTEAEIVRWLVAVGDTVALDQPVAEVETAKAVVEVSSPFTGTVTALHAVPGAQVPVGAPLLSVALTESVQPEDGADKEDGAARAAPSGSVLVGYGTGGGDRSRRHRPRPAEAGSPPAAAPEDIRRNTEGRPRGTADEGAPGRLTAVPRAKPPVRKLARDLGVDLGEVSGSGPEGLVTRADVNQAAARVPAPAPPADPSQSEDAERIPLVGVRRVTAERMATSRRQIPDATAWVDCDATGLCKLRDRLNADQSTVPATVPAAVRISPLAIILRACVAGLREFPSLNASLDAERGEIVLYRHVNLGVAAHTDRGLLVPVIRDAQRMSMLQIAAELARLARIAREGSITPTELVGSTFTVSNYGALGIDGGSPVINFPEAAILGVGRITDRPWVHKGVVKPRKVLQLSIAFDHRLCDGADAAGFLTLIADCVEHPTRLLAVL